LPAGFPEHGNRQPDLAGALKKKYRRCDYLQSRSQIVAAFGFKKVRNDMEIKVSRAQRLGWKLPIEFFVCADPEPKPVFTATKRHGSDVSGDAD